MTLRERFIEYITNYSLGKPRLYPANPRTIGRQGRALKLVEKLIGHSLDSLTDADQLLYMEKIRAYAQGTRTITTTTFQRFIWWGISHEYLTCQNLIKGNEKEIIGPPTPVKYASMTQREVSKFLRKIENKDRRLLLYTVYLCGLDSSDIIELRKADVTVDHIVARRMKLGTTQIIPLPKWLQEELYQYAQRLSRDTDHLFGIIPAKEATEQRDRKLNEIWQQCCLETGMFQHTRFKDFRVNAIRHYYFQTHDIEMVKAFAGAPETKAGWLKLLINDEDTYLKDRMKERKTNHAKKYITR